MFSRPDTAWTETGRGPAGYGLHDLRSIQGP